MTGEAGQQELSHGHGNVHVHLQLGTASVVSLGTAHGLGRQQVSKFLEVKVNMKADL